MTGRALISVSDKTNIVELARRLVAAGFSITATSGTAELLQESGIESRLVSEATGVPEYLGRKVKTLHHRLLAGIMADRDDAGQMAEAEAMGIEQYDMVVCNLYPFKKKLEKGNLALGDALGSIDIGGPALIRSAATNYRHVVALTAPEDYGPAMDEWEQYGDVSLKTRFRLAYRAFEHTSQHDTLIQNWFRSKLTGEEYPETLTLTFDKALVMRYGENPHQTAAFYREIGPIAGTVADAVQLQGKALSWTNIKDADRAVAMIKEFEEPACVIVNHVNPCGAACGQDTAEAFRLAVAADRDSAYGGVAAVNRRVDEALARAIAEIQLDVLIAPSVAEEARAMLAARRSLRVLTIEHISMRLPAGIPDIRRIGGGVLVQQQDSVLYEDASLEVPTKRRPTAEEKAELRFAMKVAKHALSNAIVLSSGRCTTGIGAGQTSRIHAVRAAIDHAGARAAGCVMASDAFLSFPDTIEALAAAGITAVIQPGGSVRDAELAEACDRHGIAMVLTGIRHFRHG